MSRLKLLAPVLLASFWLYACVCIEFAPQPAPPPEREWKFTPYPEIDPDGCCIEKPDDPIDLRQGPHAIAFEDWLNPLTKTPVVHYELINQWGQVIAIIPVNDHHRYVVKGIPRGCYFLRAVGPRDPSAPSNEACTPGLQKGRIWT